MENQISIELKEIKRQLIEARAKIVSLEIRFDNVLKKASKYEFERNQDLHTKIEYTKMLMKMKQRGTDESSLRDIGL